MVNLWYFGHKEDFGVNWRIYLERSFHTQYLSHNITVIYQDIPHIHDCLCFGSRFHKITFYFGKCSIQIIPSELRAYFILDNSNICYNIVSKMTEGCIWCSIHTIIDDIGRFNGQVNSQTCIK